MSNNNKEREYFFFDIESTGVDDFHDEIHGIAWLQEEDEAIYSPWWAMPYTVREKLADPTVTKVSHSGRRFDPMFLARKGVKIAGPIFDTLLVFQQIDENGSLGLKELTERYLGLGFLKNKKRLDEALKTAGVKHVGALCKLDLNDPLHPHLHLISEYAMEDVKNTFKLFHVGKEKLKNIHTRVTQTWGIKESPLTYLLKETLPLESVLFNIELNGVRVRTELVEEMRKDADTQAADLKGKMLALCADKIQSIEDSLYQTVLATKVTEKAKKNLKRGDKKQKTAFNWGSAEHLGELFYVKFETPPHLHAKTESGRWGTDESQINRLMALLPSKHALVPVLRSFQQYKKVDKISRTYVGDANVGIMSHVVDKGGIPYIHPRYPQRPLTGRLSSQDPNFQNLPRNSPVKRFFRPTTDDRMFLYFDYSQIELRVAAHLSQDQDLMNAFLDNEDPHINTAMSVFDVERDKVTDWMRQAAKATNFLLIFRGGPRRLHDQLLESAKLDLPEDQCKEIITKFFQKYKRLDQYLNEQLVFARRYQRVVSETGRVRRLPEIVYGNYIEYRPQRAFTGPKELVDPLVKAIQGKWHSKQPRGARYVPAPQPTSDEIFNEAGMTFAHAKKQALNFPIQCLAASICKRSLIQLDKLGYHIVTTVHDSVIIEVGRDEIHKAEEIRKVLETTYTLSVPLKTDMKVLNSFDEKDVVE